MTFTGSYTLDTYIKLDSSASNSNMIINTGYRSGSDQYIYIGLNSSDKLFYEEVGTTGNRTTASDAISKNTWYHIRVTQGDGNVKLYANGTLQLTHPNNTVSKVTGRNFTIGAPFDNNNNSNNFHGLIGPTRYAATNLGAPSAGGEATTGGALSNLSFASSIAANGDVSATNFNPFNTDINTVRGQETGYNTLNPLAKASITLSNGNLDLTHSGSTGYWQLVLSTIGMSSGKFYCEFLCQDADSVIGIAKGNHVIANDKYVGQDPGGYSYNGQNGQKINNSSGSSYGSTYTAGDVIGIAFDADNGTLSFYKNNIDQGQAFSGLTDEYYFAFSIRDTGYTHSVNFGQKPFKYAPPEGFQPLNAANVKPVKVFARPDQYVKTVLWTGNDVARSIVTGNAPDLVWIKDRSITKDPVLCDSVRGAGETLRPDDTGANVTAIQRVSSFNSNGFSVGTDSGVNNNNDNFVGWTWKAGGNKNTFNVDDVGYASAAAAGLTGGSITPTGASVGTKQGFAIIKFTNTTSNSTQSHGLTQKPDFIIWKKTSGTSHWPVYHSSLGATKYIYLNLTNAASTGSEFWNNTEPTSSVVTTKGEPNSMGSAGDTIMYLWHNVPGLQKFGQYEGNTTEGAFVELGFRPAILWIKAIDQTWYWNVHDNQRGPINPIQGNFLRLDSNAQENAGSGNNNIDFLSNGFKIRSTTAQSEPTNVNGQTYIYCAWAEAPEFNLYGAQSNAR